MIYLNIGEPDFTARPWCRRRRRAMADGATQYTQATGLPSAARAHQRLVRTSALA
jgi:aspartate/methionine/tyrosine aminotransferase